MTGQIGILNVGAGDTKLTFDKDNPAETIRAARIVKDMLRRGYALLIKTPEGQYTRVRSFDEQTCEYIIADYDPEAVIPLPEIVPEGPSSNIKRKDVDYGPSLPETGAEAASPETPAEKPRRGRPRGSTKRVSAYDVHEGTAVARTAGG